MVVEGTPDPSSHAVDIPPDQWSDYLERLSHHHLNRIVRVEVYEPQAERRQLHDLPLEGITVTLDGDQEVISIVAREEVRTHVVRVAKAPCREGPGRHDENIGN